MTRKVKWLPGALSILLMAALLFSNPYIVEASTKKPEAEHGSDIPGGETYGYNYALRVVTGTNAGDYIGGFSIRYTGEGDKQYTEFIDLHENILSESIKVANQAQGTQSNKIKYLNTLGYDIAAFSNMDQVKALSKNTTDTFLLHFDNPVVSVEEIDILTDIGVAGGTRQWSCLSMELYTLESLNGFDMAGYFSTDYNLDFTGKLIARAEPPQGKEAALIQNGVGNSDSYYRITKDSSIMHLVATDSEQDANGGCTEMYVELALADVAGAGIDAFVNPVDKKKPLSELFLPESMILKLQYYDTAGKGKTLYVPVITSALAYAMERGAINENTTLAEFMGQGQSLLLKLKLFDFQKFRGDGSKTDFELIYDPRNAASMAGLQELSAAVNSHNNIADQMLNAPVDDISLLGVYVYENVPEETFQFKVENNSILKLSDDRSTRTKYLTKYLCASTVEGLSVPVSSSSGSHILSLKKYNSGAPLEPVSKAQNYLVKVRTFPVAEAATISPVSLKLKYTGTDNAEHETAVISLPDAAKSYYGNWPGSGKTDIAYRYGMSAGQTLSFTVPISDLKSFNSATFTLQGEDTWQFDHLEIIKVSEQGIGSRHISWLDTPISVGTIKSDRKVYRDIDGQTIAAEDMLISYDGTVFLNQKDPTRTISFNGDTPDDPGIDPEAIDDWRDKYYNSMPHDITQQNLGFTLAKMNYDVTVVVGTEDFESANGDCGSSNYFYFQLEFEKGKSAYVQANQQLASDGFIEGTEATFSISTNYDYGQLTAVNVIPDDSSSDASPYDKLKIDSIRVRRYDKSVDGKLYEWEMKTTDANCWVGIDYREEAEDSNEITKENRPVEAYKTTYTSFEYRAVSQVLVAINTGTYDAGQLTATNMSAKFSGVRLDGSPFTMEVGDVLKKMYDFYGGAPHEEDAKTVSDPATMFRVGMWNYFLVGMENVKSIDSMTITYQGKEPGDWKIERVELYRVTKYNGVKIALDGYYCLDGEMEQITQSTNSNYIRSEVISPEIPTTVSVSFTEQEKPIDDSDTEDYRVSRIPVSRNDYVNIAVYMDRTQNTDYSKYNVTGAVQYYSNADVAMSSSNIHFNLRNEGSETIFYANNIGVKDICSLYQLSLQATYTESGAGLCVSTYALVQRVRAGVVIETYRFDCPANLALGKFSFSPGNGTVSTGEYQMVSLSLGEGTTDMSQSGLTAEIDDVAIAIQYRSSMGDKGTIYQSPYIFLTDQQIKNIRAHSVCHLKFNENYVNEITGIVVASTGKTMTTVVESACITTYVADPGNPTLENPNRMTFKTDGYGCSGAYYVNGKNTKVKAGSKAFTAKKAEIGSADALYPMSLVFTTGDQKTALGDMNVDGVRISLDINYKASDGENLLYTIENIKDYLVRGSFGSGEEAEIQFMGQDMTDINYIVIKISDENQTNLLRWNLARVDFSYGDAAGVKDFSIDVPEDTYVNEYEIGNEDGEITYIPTGLKLGVRSVVVVLTASSSNNEGGTTRVETTSDPAGEIPRLTLMNSSGIVTMKVDILGKDVLKSVTVHVGVNSEDDSKGYASVDPDTGLITLSIPTNRAAEYLVKVVSDENPQAVAKIIVVVNDDMAQKSSTSSSGGGSYYPTVTPVYDDTGTIDITDATEEDSVTVQGEAVEDDEDEEVVILPEDL